jgi:hypothetical protein
LRNSDQWSAIFEYFIMQCLKHLTPEVKALSFEFELGIEVQQF